MRIVINAQLDPQQSGGIAQVLVGLMHGLATLQGPEEYVFVCSPASAKWLKPYVGSNQCIEINRTVKHTLSPGIRVSDGFWESYEPDVIHFPYQTFARTEVPTVFNPHDLQHVHLPQYFTEDERKRRDVLYGEACRRATAVATASQLVKDDVVRCYGVPPDKVHVIGWGPPTAAYSRPSDEQADAFLRGHGLSNGFAIYPAQTWPHKNHLGLLEALYILRERHGVRLPLVCTGGVTDHFPQIEQRLAELNLTPQVRFLGRVEEWGLLALYRAARFMVLPTLFEAISFPILEAFAEGLPVACSNVTSLPQQLGLRGNSSATALEQCHTAGESPTAGESHAAGVLFDPRDPDDIARAMLMMCRDDDLLRDLAARGLERAKQFSWTATAERYRALYRSVAQGDAALLHGETEPARCA